MPRNKGIKSVLDSLFANIQKENIAQFKAISDSPAISQAIAAINEGEPGKFFFSLIYPISQTIDGLLAQELPNLPQLQFLFKHSEFVERHYRQLIEDIEGNACSADKTRTIMRHLAASLRENTTIVFDYNQQYTYHLPQKIFTTHGEILEFFEALQHLYYGDSARFLIQLARKTSSFRARMDSAAAEGRLAFCHTSCYNRIIP